MKKTLLSFLTLLLSIGLFSQANPLPIHAGGHDTLNIIENVTLEHKSGSKPIEIIGNDTIVSVYDMIIVNYEFKLDDLINYQNQVAHFTLPSIFDADKTILNLDIVKNGEIIAKLERTPGTLDMTLTFTDSDFLVDNSNITGNIRIFTQFDQSQITTQKKYPVEFDGLSTIDVEVNPPSGPVSPEHAYVWKGGTLQPDKETILWEIYITAYTDLTDVVMNDVHTAGQEIIPESFSIDKTTHVDASGVTHFSPAPTLVPVFNGTDGFTLDVGTLYYEGTSAEGSPISNVEHTEKHDLIRIRYMTKITELKEVYQNNISFTASQLGTEVRDMESFVVGGSGIIVGETKAITLQKIDSETHKGILGAKFKLEKLNTKTNTWFLYQDEIEVNDVNGITVSKLTFGTYRFVETEAPQGYVLNDTPQEPFVVDANTSVSNTLLLQYENTKTYGSIMIEKYSSYDHSLLSGAVFELRAKNGGRIYRLDPTDQNGIAKLDGIELGDYELHEVQAPSGYKTLGYVLDVTIKDNLVFPKVIVLNDILKGSAQLKKVDDRGTLLSGAVFKLQTTEGVELLNNLVTDENGLIIVNDLIPGNYEFVETKAPKGHMLDATPVRFTVTLGSQQVIELEKTNLRIVTPEIPVKPTEPTNPEKPIVPGDSNENHKEDILPSTGITDKRYLGGMILSALGVAILVLKNKKIFIK